MRQGTIWCALAITWVGTGYPAAGQTTELSTEELLKEIRLLRGRFESLEEKHEEDQRRIQELESRLDRLETPPTPDEQAKQIEEIRSAIKAEMDQPRPSSGLFDLSAPGLGGGNLLNPQITVFVETGGSLSSRGSNRALNRFNVREVELDFRAAISPSADGVLILAIEEGIELGRDGRIDIERVFDVEEAYIDFHTLPWDLSLKIGKFRNAIGRNNLLHTHDLPQVTRPLAVAKFLGPEGLSTTGASLSWLVPNPWDKYLELEAEIVNADGGEEAPLLGGPNAENPAVLAHIKFFDDITETSSFEIGGTYLFGRTSDDRDFDANIFGLDLTYHWVHPDPSKFRSLILQSELFWADNDIDRGFFRSERNSSFGAYAFGQYQLNRDWYIGLRTDYTEFPNSESRGSDDWDFAFSPYITWYITEFLRARVEYQHRFLEVDGSSRDEDAVFLQFTGVFGAHPPHPYWVRR